MIRKIAFLFLTFLFFTQVHAQSITVTSPNGGEKVYTGKDYSVKWTSTAISSSFVKLEYSVDSGSTWLLINVGVNNTGSYAWNTPVEVTGVNCLLRISDFADTSVYDVSDAVFSIQQPFITLVSPNGGGTLTGCTTSTIEWEQGGIKNYVNLYYSINGGADWIHIGSDYIADNSNYYDWSVPSIGDSTIRIKVSGYYEPGVSDESDANFTITKPANSITITSPNGGESFSASSYQDITWNTTGTVGNVSIKYSKDGGANWSWVTSLDGTSASNIPNTGSYAWVLPQNINASNCLIQLYENSKTCNIDYSNNFFTIDNNPAVTITFPNGGEKLYVNRSYSITWSASFFPTNYIKLEYSVDNGNTWNVIINSTYNNGSYSWNIPNASSSQCLFRVSAAANPAIADISDNPFTVAPQTLVLTSPVGGESLSGCETFPIT